MKNVLIIFIIMMLGIGIFVYIAEPDTFKTISEGVAEPSKKTEPDQPKRNTAKPKPAPGSLLVPAGLGTVYVNGKAVTGSIRGRGEQVVASYDGSNYSHQVLILTPGKEITLKLRQEPVLAVSGWSTFQGNNRRVGHVLARDRQSLSVAWQKELAEKVMSSPIIVGDTAYFSSEAAMIVALDLKSGDVLWKKGGLGSSVTPIASEQVVFASNDMGHLATYRLKDGKQRGQLSFNSYATGLGLVKGHAFLVRTRGGMVFNIQTKQNFRGKLPLKFNWESDLGLAVECSTPVILADRAIFYSRSGLEAISLSDGQVIWSRDRAEAGATASGNIKLDLYDDASFLPPTPCADDSTLFSCTDKLGEIQAVSIDEGKRLWRVETGVRITSSLSLAYGFLFFGTADGHLMALSTRSHKPLFKVRLGRKPIFASPVLFGDKLLTASHEGELFLQNCFTGAILARNAALSGQAVFATPAVTDSHILAINVAGRMVCYR